MRTSRCTGPESFLAALFTIVTAAASIFPSGILKRLSAAGMEPSAGSVGDFYDNALAESVIGLFKTEVIGRRGPWRWLEAVE